MTSRYALIFYSPICLDPIEEKDIALTPCAHKFCGECIRSCLESLSSSREPRGNCPECRELIKLSELTFLGDAKDCGEKKLTSNDEDQKPQAGEKSEEPVKNKATFDKDLLEVLREIIRAECSRFEPKTVSEPKSGPKEKEAASKGPSTCFRCKKTGHWARNCPEASGTASAMDEVPMEAEEAAPTSSEN